MNGAQLEMQLKYRLNVRTPWVFPAVGALLLLGLTACSSTTLSLERASSEAPAFHGWQHMALPGKAATVYLPVHVAGREAMEVQALSSASLLRRKLGIASEDLGQIRFSWRVPALMPTADLARRDSADSVVRVVLSFEGDRSQFSPRDSMLSELVQVMTGDPLPYATLMYVWCPTREAGSVITNPRTGRIRKLVVESGPARLNQWLDYERDIRADYRKVFGEEPGRLIGVAIMTDSDNTQSQARAWYGPVELDGAMLARHP